MQGYTDPPRQDLDQVTITNLITGNGVRRGFGLDLLDTGNSYVEGLGRYCRGWSVRYDNTAEVHGSLTVQLTTALPWGRARVRPYYTLSKDGVTARFNQGVYVLTTPVLQRGRTPMLYQVSGQNVLQPLTRNIGDTYVVTAGTTYLQALRAMLNAAGHAGTVVLDGTRGDTALPEERVWALPAGPRWLDVANDLMAEIAYTDLFADENGVYRARPVAPLEDRPVEWLFDAQDPLVDLVDADRSEEYDAWSAPNVWRFVRRQLTYQPVLTDGIVEFVNQSDGESSIDSVGEVPVVHYLDVADQATLEAEGLRIVDADRRAERRVTMRVDPLPLAGHQDVVEYRDAGVRRKMAVTSWELSTGGKGTWVLGGGGGGAAPVRGEQQSTATVTQASPLRVVVDGATTDSRANVLDGASYSVGQRVTVTVRNPLPPLVQGVES